MQRQAKPGAPLGLLVAVWLLAGCGEQDAPDDETDPVRAPRIARLVPASDAIAGAHIPTLDPATMVDAEILKVLGPGSRCEFRYTSEGRPVLAARATSDGKAPDAVVKLNGHLVALRRTPKEAGSLVFAADRVRLIVKADGAEHPIGARQREADAVFEVGGSLRAGYRGDYRCVE